ncbi:MAG: cation:proton antiporter [Planctomycetota bacterium]
MDAWPILFDVLLLLSGATVLGILCACIRQSPILGYLAAGTLLGPNALQLVSTRDEVALLAELGIALLLFTIGLEFSWRRLIGLGRTAIGGGLLQVSITLALVAGICAIIGQPIRTSIALGAIVALSSTACVLRLLVSRAEIETHHGRHALGVLLVQDAAVVPLVLLVSLLGGSAGFADMSWTIARVLGGAAALVASLYILLRFVMPRLLELETLRHSRELPVLLAMVVGLGAAWASHEFGLSPALGAFVAGMLLAASPFATQIRADVSSLQALLVTLFFSSIGMLGDPGWLLEHVGEVMLVVFSVVVGKAIIVWLVLRILGLAHESALMSGLCLAQIGEFSFILAMTAHGSLIDDELLKLIVSATIISLFATPYLVSTAPWLAPRIIAGLHRIRLVSASPMSSVAPSEALQGHIILIGFGPAGQTVGRALADRDEQVVVVDLSRKAIQFAREMGLDGHVGDATHADVLRHAGVQHADVVVITLPAPSVAVQIVELVRSITPTAMIVARARYHMFVDEMSVSGAHEVVDEESMTGQRLAAHVRRHLASRSPQPPA